MVPNAKSCCQDTEDQERLCRCLVLDIILNRVRQQKSGLEIHLWQDECHEDASVQGFVNGEEVSGDTKLGQCDGKRANPLGLVDTKCNGKRL